MPSAYLIYLDIVVPVSVLIPVGVAVVNRKYISKELKVIWYYLLLDGCANILAAALAELNIRNLPVLHIYTVFEMLLLSYFYLQVLKDKKVKLGIKCLMFIFPVLCIVNFSFFQSINNFNTNTRPIEALIIMACSLAYFAETNDTGTKWSLIPVNWINTGILIYFSGALFIFSFSNVTAVHMSKKYHAVNVLMWNIHGTLVLVMYILFAVGFSKCRKH
jgi:hypothetical protein